MKETLRAYQRMKNRQAQSSTGSNKFRSRPTPSFPPTPAKPDRGLRALRVEIEESGPDSYLSGSNGEEEPRNVFVAATSDRMKNLGDQGADPGENCLEGSADCVTLNKACTHSGSKRHDDHGCWKRLTCQKCGRKGHPSDKCLHVRAACGETHDCGKCPMEEFYNLIRKWCVPSKHADMFPHKVEKMLN